MLDLGRALVIDRWQPERVPLSPVTRGWGQ